MRFFNRDKEKSDSDFAEFFSKPIDEQKKVIKSVVREANEEQKELYERFRTNSALEKVS